MAKVVSEPFDMSAVTSSVTSTMTSPTSISASSDSSSVAPTPTASFSSGTSHRSSYHRPPSVVIVTRDAKTKETQEGFKQINHYLLKKEIGRGAFGIVHLGVDTDNEVEYAIKEFSKSRLRRNNKSNLYKHGPGGRRMFRGRGRGLGVARGGAVSPRDPEDDDPLLLVRSEVAILKKLNHDNVVKLIEVLDDPKDDSLYMVFEMCSKGVVMNVSVDETAEPYSDENCRKWFRQMILGFEYLHENDIVHRDIKPDNLLIAEDDTLKIVDFGVSEIFVKGSDMLKKSAGSPAFMSPELCTAHHGEVSGRAADIWSMGVTLYCLKYGCLPFPKYNIIELYESIKNDPVTYPSPASPLLLDIFSKLLEKDPQQRITMGELRVHPWVTNEGTDPLPSAEVNCSELITEVTEEDMQNAIKPIANIFVVIKAITKLRRHSRSLSKDAASVLAGSDSDASSNELARNTRADSLSVPVHEDDEEEESKI